VCQCHNIEFGEMRAQSVMQNTLPSGAARKPPLKRRKLTAVESPQSQTKPSDEDVQIRVSKVIVAAGGRPVCTTCQRAINARPECMILCALYEHESPLLNELLILILKL